LRLFEVLGTSVSWKQPELLFPGVTRRPFVLVVNRNSGFQEPTGTPRSRSQPELWVPRVNWNCGLQESPGTRGYRSHPELLVPEVTWRTQGSLNNPEDSASHESPGTPVSPSHPELRVHGVTRNSMFPESLIPGSRSSA